jgi:hypothetical protein
MMRIPGLILRGIQQFLSFDTLVPQMSCGTAGTRPGAGASRQPQWTFRATEGKARPIPRSICETSDAGFEMKRVFPSLLARGLYRHSAESYLGLGVAYLGERLGRHRAGPDR